MTHRSRADVIADVEASYAATHARLANDPEYQRLRAAAALEERETPAQHFHRNHLAIYIELHTPLTPRPPDG